MLHNWITTIEAGTALNMMHPVARVHLVIPTLQVLSQLNGRFKDIEHDSWQDLLRYPNSNAALQQAMG